MANLVEALRYAVGQLDAGQYAEVERVARDVLRHDAFNADALHLLGLASRKQEQSETSVDCFRRAVEVKPEKPLYHFELGVSLRMAGEIEAAFAAYQRAIELDPAMHAAYVNAGAALDDLGRNEEALAWYERALALKPNCQHTHTNLGNAYQALGRFEDSIASYRRAIAIDPASAPQHWNFAMALLRCGQFREGWAEYEWRSAANETKLDLYPQPRWDGSSLAGKTLLVHAEQGIGDEVLFASCYPDVLAQAEHCVFICEPRLAALFTRSFPTATVIGYRRRHERDPYLVERHVDFQIPAGSLPHFLRPETASFPQRERYLLPDPARVQLWRERFAALGPGLKVGISWRAGGKPSEQVRRTTDLALWRRIFALPNVQFINLQYGQATEEIARAREWGVTIHDWEDADALTDLDGLAAMICAMDLVVSVGNTTVHLAGALGAPAWSLVAANPSWRWMDDGDRVPWYTSVRLFRQQRGTTWPSVLDRVHRELCEKLGVSPSQEIIEPVDVPAMQIPAQVSGMKFVAKLTETIERAVKHHQAGELAPAETIYRQVLKNTPQHTDALHLLGVICQQTGRTREALKLIRQAIALCNDVASFHFHLALALKDDGQAEEAIRSYRRTLELKPDFAEAYLNLGVALQEQGRLDEAIECYQQALAVSEQNVGLHLNLGAALRTKGCFDDARGHFHRALELQPVCPEARVQLGLLMQDQRQMAAAISQYQQALAEKPDHAAAFRCLGKVLQEQQRWDEAIECYQRTLELRPNDFEAAANLGVAFERQEQFALAVSSYRQALKLQRHPQTELRLIDSLRHAGKLNEALQACDQLIAAEPENADAHWTRSQILLQQGDLARGWEEYSWRWRLPGRREPQVAGIPQWNGSSLRGKAILVHMDELLGDTLMFLPCLTEIATRAARTVVACDPRLVDLLARSFPAVDVRPAGSPLSADLQISLARLPQQLHFSEADFHWRVPLLAKSQKPRGSQPRVGYLMRGLHKAQVQPGSSRAPAIEQWKELLNTRGIEFVDLSHETTGDFDALATQLAALDLIITVDDLVPHLAASMNKDVWLVLPHAWGWQWPLTGDTCPWYSSVRLFRPARPNAWPALMSRVHTGLQQWLTSRSAPHAVIKPPHLLRTQQPS